MLAAWLIFAAYLLAARGIRNSFPFSVFDMYQARGNTTAARVVVLDAQGTQHELDAFAALRCDPVPQLSAALQTCSAEHRPLDYVVRDQQQLLESRLVGEAQPMPMALVSRAWTFAETATTTADCELARCTAMRGPP
jgi:hypothetical protein